MGRRLKPISPQIYFTSRAKAQGFLSPKRPGPVFVGRTGDVSEVWLWDHALGESILLGPGLYSLADIFAVTGWRGARLSLLSETDTLIGVWRWLGTPQVWVPWWVDFTASSPSHWAGRWTDYQGESETDWVTTPGSGIVFLDQARTALSLLSGSIARDKIEYARIEATWSARGITGVLDGSSRARWSCGFRGGATARVMSGGLFYDGTTWEAGLSYAAATGPTAASTRTVTGAPGTGLLSTWCGLSPLGGASSISYSVGGHIMESAAEGESFVDLSPDTTVFAWPLDAIYIECVDSGAVVVPSGTLETLDFHWREAA